MSKVYAYLVCMCLAMGAFAQDPHFSQFYASPLSLNPAMTGKFYGDVRYNGVYRNQWPTINNAFITTTGAIDAHVGKESIASNDNLGIGAIFLSDKSANGAVNQSFFTFSSAYHKGLDDDGAQQLSGGVQVTYSNMNINTADLKFEDQLTQNGFTGNTSESFGNNAQLPANYVDVNAGILYSMPIAERHYFYGGVSVYHINSPSQTLARGLTYNIKQRYSINLGGTINFNPYTNLHLSGLHSTQAGATETVLGGTMQFIANPEDEYPTSFYVGTWGRLKDAFIPYIGLEFNDARLGVTYDFNTSALKTASQGKGGIEISLLYIHHKDRSKPIPCPKF